MAINLEKSTATATFRPLVIVGGLYLHCNIKVDLQGFGKHHVQASNNFYQMVGIISRQFGCTVQRCTYEAKPAPYVFSFDNHGQTITRAQQARQLLHVVLHGNDCERAAYEIKKRFLESLQRVSVVY